MGDHDEFDHDNEIVPTKPDLASLKDITPAFLRQNYIGIELLDPFTGKVLPDDFYKIHIKIAMSIFEREANVQLQRIKVEEEKHDYLIQDYMTFSFISLFKPPVTKVTKFALRYPANEIDMVFPIDWVRLSPPNQIYIVPLAGTLSQALIGQGGNFLPLLSQISYLPELFRIDYICGFADGTLPYDILDGICKLAVISIFAARSDSIFPPGMTSLSLGIDGMSQAFGILNNGQQVAVFGSRVAYYRQELFGVPGQNNGFLHDTKIRYSGISMQVA